MMGKEEKIALLVDELEDIRCDNFDADTDEDKTLKEAIRLIKASKQEPKTDVLDKIKEEVEKIFDDRPRGYNHNQRTEFYVKVLQIIDKYRTESEESDEISD